jgi:hypothetical protein
MSLKDAMEIELVIVKEDEIKRKTVTQSKSSNKYFQVTAIRHPYTGDELTLGEAIDQGLFIEETGTNFI